MSVDPKVQRIAVISKDVILFRNSQKGILPICPTGCVLKTSEVHTLYSDCKVHSCRQFFYQSVTYALL